jgi:hypothetical protein
MILIAVFLFCQLAWSAPMPRESVQPTVAEQYLFAKANAERTQRGLRPLHWDDTLYRAAVEHAREMAAREAISHQFPGELDLSARGRQTGARFSRIAENVAEAPTAVQIHQAWMHSPGHRANLLDPAVDSLGIGVSSRDGELFAVEDFDHSFTKLSLDEQESEVGELLHSNSSIAILPRSGDARRTCAMETGYAGGRMPWFIMRYTAADLSRLPDTLKQKLASRKYHRAAVGACAASGTQNFSAYSIAVMLYP